MSRLAGPIEAKYADYEPDFGEQTRTAAQRAGILYEKKTLKRLESLYHKLEPGPWLYYKSATRSGVCQPDGLLWLSPDLLCILECKLSWVRGARHKLLTFYGPIVQAIHKKVELCYLQVYKNVRRGAHKRPISLYKLDDMKPGSYKECQHLV